MTAEIPTSAVASATATATPPVDDADADVAARPSVVVLVAFDEDSALAFLFAV